MNLFQPYWRCLQGLCTQRYLAVVALVIVAFTHLVVAFASDVAYPPTFYKYGNTSQYPSSEVTTAQHRHPPKQPENEGASSGSTYSGAKARFGRTATGFVYDAMQPMRYEQLKLAWLNQHPGETPTPGDMENLAHASFLTQHSTTPLWKDITHWRMVGGPHPWHVVPRIQLENPSNAQAILGLRVGVSISALYGVWYPENKGAITDVALLKRNPERHAITQYSLPVEGLATRDYLLKELKPIALMPILKARPDRFPNELSVALTLLQDGQKVDVRTLRLTLYPDVFALPIYLY
jgi:hypothetical protein